MNIRESIEQLRDEIGLSIIGQHDLIDKIIIAILADGNMLLEGVPGLAKTRTVNSLAKGLEATLNRIQFTPDLLPSDITGTEVYQPEMSEKFRFMKGPLFGNLILADEINRAPAKVQAALLEAMEERQITVAGTSHKMEPLFMVLATQNPVDQEGTYPLPEAQMDRFLMKVVLDYPSIDEEKQIIRLVREEQKSKATKSQVISQESIFKARDEIKRVEVSEAAEDYIVGLVDATRHPVKISEDLARYIDIGASPRASIALDRCSRAVAWLGGRDFVSPDDIRSVAHVVLRHRIILSYEASAEGVTTDQIIDKIVAGVAVI